LATHLNPLKIDNEVDKADVLHFKFALLHPKVEAYIMKLCKEEPTVFYILLKEVKVENNVV
jgi:hypothetical protein